MDMITLHLEYGDLNYPHIFLLLPSIEHLLVDSEEHEQD